MSRIRVHDWILKVFPALFFFSFLVGSLHAQEESGKVPDVRVKMSDGVHLSADVYLPDSTGKFPVILIRTPYNKSGLTKIGEHFAKTGYAVLIQDVRGQGKSEGQFMPFTFEKQDGLETLNWLDLQPWCNGEVGLWGVSYLAYNGFMVLPYQHKSIKTFVSISGFSEMDKFLGTGGAFYLQAHLTWFMTRVGGRKLPPAEAMSKFMDRIFRTTPLSTFFQGGGKDTEVTQPKFQDISGEFHKVNIPVLHLTGWHDYLYRSTLGSHQRIKDQHKDKVFQKLIVGPWYHNQELTERSMVGDLDFGPKAQMGLERILALSTKWFDHWIKGKENDIKKESPVRVFVMGLNDWKDFDEWPPRSVEYRKWYFSSEKGANSSAGDGLLSTLLPKRRSHDSFVFDPNDPVPTVGGANFHLFHDNLGVKNQVEIEKRQDVLVYTSALLDRPMQVIGPLKVILYASTEGVDTDFTAKIVEVKKDGYARIIEDGIIRARNRKSLTKPEMVKPGEIYQYEIDLGATAIELESGSRIRVEISSSNFPKYDRNPNTGEEPMDAVEFKKVLQKIFFSKEYPSHILLPVLK